MGRVRPFAFAAMLALFIALTVLLDTAIIWFVGFSFSSGFRLPTSFWLVALLGVIITACAAQLARAFRRYQREQL